MHQWFQEKSTGKKSWLQIVGQCGGGRRYDLNSRDITFLFQSYFDISHGILFHQSHYFVTSVTLENLTVYIKEDMLVMVHYLSGIIYHAWFQAGLHYCHLLWCLWPFISVALLTPCYCQPFSLFFVFFCLLFFVFVFAFFLRMIIL